MSKIKFVRAYTGYGSNFFDIIYCSGRCVTKTEDAIPTTVKNFIENAWNVTKHYDNIFKRWETIYE